MKKINIKAFSLLEVLVGSIIFVIGFAAVYKMVVTTIDLNKYNKDYIIATSLAREQLELFRNIRDTNFKKISNFDIKDPWACDDGVCEYFLGNNEDQKIYKIRNNFDNSSNKKVIVESSQISEITDFSDLSPEERKEFQVCFDEVENLYDYCDNIADGPNKKEYMVYKYIEVKGLYSNKESDKIKRMIGENGSFQKCVRANNEIQNKCSEFTNQDAIRVISKVYWYNRGFRSFEVETFFTNYKMY